MGRTGISISALAIFLLVPMLSLYAGYRLGSAGNDSVVASALSASLQGEMEKQREVVVKAKQDAQENLNALSLRLGQLQAHVVRLDALGQRLTRISGLDNGEFNFDEPPAQGGPVSASEMSNVEVEDFVDQLDTLFVQLDDRSQQLELLETMLVNRNVQEEVQPAGRPVVQGWISSHFGKRTDPFTGKIEIHKGIDVAGKEGTDVIAVAAGVITWSGKRYGYGNLVEIDHGNGIVTRYGHNRETVVKVGDTVKKGQVIAHMGSTGRSTGPHVHFEVRNNGVAVDPMNYIATSN